MHRLTESDFPFDVTYGGCDVILHRNLLPPSGESIGSVFPAAVQQRRQFLIYSTFAYTCSFTCHYYKTSTN